MYIHNKHAIKIDFFFCKRTKPFQQTSNILLTKLEGTHLYIFFILLIYLFQMSFNFSVSSIQLDSQRPRFWFKITIYFCFYYSSLSSNDLKPDLDYQKRIFITNDCLHCWCHAWHELKIYNVRKIVFIFTLIVKYKSKQKNPWINKTQNCFVLV